jgi:hypothetical protein
MGNKEKTGARIEVFLLRELNSEQRLWDVLVDPARKIRIGNKLYFGEDEILVAEVIDNTTSRGRTLRFLSDTPYDDFRKLLLDPNQTQVTLCLRWFIFCFLGIALFLISSVIISLFATIYICFQMIKNCYNNKFIEIV